MSQWERSATLALIVPAPPTLSTVSRGTITIFPFTRPWGVATFAPGRNIVTVVFASVMPSG